MNTKTQTILGVVVVVILIAAVGIYFLRGESAPDNQLGGGVLGVYEGAAATIMRTDDGYEPRDVTIKVGEALSFKNESEEFHWPASDVHPTHSIYSEFDPDAPIAPGETWTFVFTRVGEWKYHDHIRANLRGTITVVE